MTIEVRREVDLELIKKWWKERTDVDFNPEILSDFGFTGFYEDTPIASMFFFPILGSKVATLGWPISDFSVDKNLRDLILDEILEEIHVFAKEIGYKYIWTTSGVPVVKERLLRHNYLEGDEGITQFWRVL